MKKFLMTLLTVFGIGLISQAQIETPMASPFSKIEQKIGVTDVSLEYSRPSMRGRSIFGKIVPYGEIWRTGANVNTKITFGDDVKINGKELKKGTYALYSVPNKTSWDIIFYQKHDNWGNPTFWDPSLEALRVTVNSITLPTATETFTISFSNLQHEEGTLNLNWDTTEVSIKIWVPTSEKVEKRIQQVMAGPSVRDYVSAARYYLEQEKNLETALLYINKALEINQENFGSLRTKALILWKLDKKSEAIAVMKQSLEFAKKAKNNDYIKLNEVSLLEWM